MQLSTFWGSFCLLSVLSVVKYAFCFQLLVPSISLVSALLSTDISCVLSVVPFSIILFLTSAHRICINLNLSEISTPENSEIEGLKQLQVQFQKVTDIRGASLRVPGPYYRHWPVKYSIAYEHAQQNDIIWEDVTLYTKVTHSPTGAGEAESTTSWR